MPCYCAASRPLLHLAGRASRTAGPPPLLAWHVASPPQGGLQGEGSWKGSGGEWGEDREGGEAAERWRREGWRLREGGIRSRYAAGKEKGGVIDVVGVGTASG